MITRPVIRDLSKERIHKNKPMPIKMKAWLMGFDDMWPLDVCVIDKNMALQLEGDGFWAVRDPSTGEIFARRPVDFKLFDPKAKV